MKEDQNAYDTIGNRTSDTLNGMSRNYAANCLNQYTQVDAAQNDFLTKMQYENDHISVARRHEQAIQDFKRRVESICDCPKSAREAKDKEEQDLIRKVQALKEENAAYDAPGGPHVLRR